MGKAWLAVAAGVALAVQRSAVEACTTVAFGSATTVMEAPATAHTADCSDCDMRLALVPGRHHPKGAMAEIYGVGHWWPRQRSNRAYIYQDMPHVEPIAHIPQVEYTYGLYETMYALMNEKGLTLGESSCSSKISAAGLDMKYENGTLGTAYFSIAALMQLALERCATAVCAIETMGALAEKHGFYGESLMGGEALTIADTTGESWVFHVMQDYTTHSSAIWVAQRVPEGHVAAIANEFTIQEVPEGEHPDFMYSSNLRSEAVAAGFWNGTGVFNFQQVYGTKGVVGENMYAVVRLHWIYSNIAPSLNLTIPDSHSPSYFNFSYPSERKLSIADILDLFRGHYDGTEWDLSKGILAGPFGNPKRIEGGEGLKQVKGMLPRPISIPRTSHTHVGIASKHNPVAFFSPDEPSSAVFAPFLAKTLEEAANATLAETVGMYSRYYGVGKRDEFQYRKSAWWAFDGVANQLNLFYSNMTGQFVNPAIEKWQSTMIKLYETSDSYETIASSQDRLIEAWWDLYDKLIVSYNDGTFNYYPGADPKKPYAAIGYPEQFLRDIGFDKDFWKVQTVQGQIEKTCGAKALKADDAVVQVGAGHPLVGHALSLTAGLVVGAVVASVVNRRKAAVPHNQMGQPLLLGESTQL